MLDPAGVTEGMILFTNSSGQWQYGGGFEEETLRHGCYLGNIMEVAIAARQEAAASRQGRRHGILHPILAVGRRSATF